jgi:hypothetical protein
VPTTPDRRHTDRRSSDRAIGLTGLLASWRFWMVLWGCALTGVAIFALVTYSREASDRAARHAALRAQYVQCINSIPTFTKVNRFVEGVQLLHRVLVENAKQVHSVTPPGTATYLAQAINLRRLEVSVRDVSGVRFRVPTPADCRAQSR